MKIHLLWYICLTIRLFIAFIPLIYNYIQPIINKNNIIHKLYSINKYIILLIGIGFLYKSVFGSNNEVQINKVFWHKTRIMHSLFYIFSAINYNNYKLSSFLLFSDIIFSVIYRVFSGHFTFQIN